ncbi:hypothetical protein J4Q44_G00183720 [Coregonus suidteri]|uniref:Uncharacterized protein n=1 Tax=Coregonus suidteri TaxID=861788 RepID=A0AAN8LL66_9TELE
MFVMFSPTIMFPVVAESETVQHLLQPGLHFQRQDLHQATYQGAATLEKKSTRNLIWTKGKSELSWFHQSLLFLLWCPCKTQDQRDVQRWALWIFLRTL